MNNLSREQTRRHIVLPLILLLAAAAAAVALIRTRPGAAHRPTAEMVALVAVMEAAPSTETVRVPAMGTVIPSVRVDLVAEVPGVVVGQHPRLIPGGRVRTGEALVKLDARDYEYALDQQKAALDKALFELKVEQGRKQIAEEEWKQLGFEGQADKDARSLALREPHLKTAESAVAAAKSALSKARLNLDRTAIRAPFDALVLDKFTDMGQYVTPQGRVATLAGVAGVWIQTPVPVEALRWINLPDEAGENGSRARVIQEAGRGAPVVRTGRVIRLQGDLDPAGRMARLLILIQDPFSPEAELPLLLGSYVRVEIEGRRLENVYRLPRTAIRDNAQVWLMDAADRLEIRPVDVLWTLEHDGFVRGLAPGERVVTGSIALPVPGMKLRREGRPGAAEPAAEATPE